MVASFKAEWLKLRKRPLTWVAGGALVTMVVLMGYVFLYVTMQNIAADPANGDEVEGIRTVLRGENVAVVTLDILARFGSIVVVLFGATLAGSEYGWNTVKTAMTQRGPRREIVLGTVMAYGAVIGVMVVAAVAVAWVASLVLAGPADNPVSIPQLTTLFPAMGATWLTLMAYTLLGAALANILRGAALAVGIGIVYVVMIETLVSGLAQRFAFLGYVEDFLVRPNAVALTQHFIPEGWLGGQIPAIDPWQAAAMVTLFAAGSVAVMLGLQRRDYA